jgi:hypothetical protein
MSDQRIRPMPRYDDDDDDEDYDVDEFDDAYGDDDDVTIPCPHCGREIHEEAERCPHCEKYLSDEDSPPTRKPWWIYLGVAVCLYLVYRWIVGW